MSKLTNGMNKPVSRRDLLKGAGAGAAGLVLSACGGAPAQPTAAPEVKGTPPPPQKVEIVFQGRTGAQGDFFNKMAEAFAASTNGMTTVKVELTPGADYVTKLATLAAGGQLGDAYHTYPFGNMYPFASQGVAMALDGMISADKAWDPNQFFPVAVDLCKWNGKTFAVPIGLHAGWSGWVINTDMWEKAGCATPKWEWSYEKEWLENVVKMQDYLNKQTDKKRFAYQFDYSAPAQNSLLFIASYGGNWIEATERKKAMIDNEKTVAGLSLMRDLVNKYKVSPKRTDVVENSFQNQLIASVSNGIFAIGTYKSTVKDFKWQFYPAPSGPNGTRGTFVGVDYFCMSAKSKNAKATMDWFKFFILNKDNAKAMLAAGFSPSAVRENWNTSPLSDDPNYTQAKQWLDIAKGWTLPHNARVSEFNQAYTSGFEALINEANDFKTEIGNLQKKIQAVLDQPPV